MHTQVRNPGLHIRGGRESRDPEDLIEQVNAAIAIQVAWEEEAILDEEDLEEDDESEQEDVEEEQVKKEAVEEENVNKETEEEDRKETE